MADLFPDAPRQPRPRPSNLPRGQALQPPVYLGQEWTRGKPPGAWHEMPNPHGMGAVEFVRAQTGSKGRRDPEGEFGPVLVKNISRNGEMTWRLFDDFVAAFECLAAEARARRDQYGKQMTLGAE